MDISFEDLDEKFGLKSLGNREFKSEKVSAFQQFLYFTFYIFFITLTRSNLTDSIVWLNSAVFNYYSKTKK